MQHVLCKYLYRNWMRGDERLRITSHAHPYWQVEFVLSGRVVSRVDGGVYDQRGGCAILLPPDTPHGFDYREPGTSIFSVKFEERSRLLERAVHTLSPSKGLEALRVSLEEFLTIPPRPDSPTVAVVDHLVGGLAQLFAATSSAAAERPTTVVERIRRLVDSTEGRRLTVASIAEQLGFSPSYVRAQFREATGMRLKDYVDRRRSSVAEMYLAYSDMTLQQIADALEFPDPQVFSRFCRRMLGKSPGQLRRLFTESKRARPGVGAGPR